MSKSKSFFSLQHKIARRNQTFNAIVSPASLPTLGSQNVVKQWRPVASTSSSRQFHSLPSSNSTNAFDPSFPYGQSNSHPGTKPHSIPPSPTSSSQSSHSGQGNFNHALTISSEFTLPAEATLPDLPIIGSLSQSTSQTASSSSSSNSTFWYAPTSSRNRSASSNAIQSSQIKTPKQAERSALLSLQNGASGIPKTSHSLVPTTNPAHVQAANVGVKAKVWAGAGRSKASAGESQLVNTLPENFKSVGVGQDAYFLRPDSLGVADGVGGWSGHKDADPALFSRLLMHYCAAELERYEDVDDPLFLDYFAVDPIEILQTATDASLAEAKVRGMIGSTTALLAILRRDTLRVANLGDCNCSIIRGTDYLFRSEEQQHSFNYPCQIGTNSKDTPAKDGQRFDVQVQKDDIVILSSDGLCDNLFEDDILEEVLRFSHPGFCLSEPDTPAKRVPFSPQAVSEALCSRAKAVCEDQMATTSPFQQKAMEEGIYYTGGKRDDISVLVAVVGDLEDAADRR